MILQEVQMLDEQVAPARRLAQQRAQLRERFRIDLATFRRRARLAFDIRHFHSPFNVPAAVKNSARGACRRATGGDRLIRA
jgi:hypothetical protein